MVNIIKVHKLLIYTNVYGLECGLVVGCLTSVIQHQRGESEREHYQNCYNTDSISTEIGIHDFIIAFKLSVHW